jgi:hypothetical protein
MSLRSVLFIFMGPFGQADLIIDELTFFTGMGNYQSMSIVYGRMMNTG